jgi:hypothetical protein
MTTTITNVRQYLDFSVMARNRLQPGKKPEGWKYLCIEDLVNSEGVDFTSEPLTDEELAIVFDAVDNSRKRFKQRECFYNAQMLVHFDETDTLVYHEGYAFGRAIIAVHHGWASINGKVIDLTWRLEKGRSKGRLRDRIIGEYPEGYEYLGIPFPDKNLLRQIMVRRGWCGTLLDDWEKQWPLVRGESLVDAYTD